MLHNFVNQLLYRICPWLYKLMAISVTGFQAVTENMTITEFTKLLPKVTFKFLEKH